MAATTTLLGLVTPTQGSLPGVWGDTVNYGITEYLDIAIAGTLTLTGDGTVILANTTGSSSGTNITSTLSGAGTVTAQFAIVKVSGTTGVKIVQAPSFSRTYLVVNASSFAVTFKPSAAPGVSIAAGETASVYYNGTDYVKVVGTATAGAAGGSTTQVQYNNAGVLAGITGATTNGTALTLVAPNLGSPASVGTMPAFTLGGTVSGGGNQINNVIIGTSTPLAGAFTTLSATGVTTVQAGTAALPAIVSTTGTADTGFWFPAADTVAVSTAGTERMRLDSSGNLGLGVTPSAWGAGTSVIQLATAGSAGAVSSSGTLSLANNGFFNGTNWIYNNTSSALLYQLISNEHRWSNAPSGTAGNAISFTQAMTLDASGNLLVGVATANANGGVLQLKNGITFPATQSASTDANTLDDYEEGVWTPAVTFGGGATGVTFGVSNGGTYTKVGRIVTVCGILDLTSKGSSTGNISITGLPFSGSNFGGAALTLYGLTFTGQAYGQPNGAAMVLFQILAGTRTALTDTAFANDTSIAIQITYYV